MVVSTIQDIIMDQQVYSITGQLEQQALQQRKKDLEFKQKKELETEKKDPLRLYWHDAVIF